MEALDKDLARKFDEDSLLNGLKLKASNADYFLMNPLTWESSKIEDVLKAVRRRLNPSRAYSDVSEFLEPPRPNQA